MSKASQTEQPEEGTAASAEATDRNQVHALQPRGSIDYVEAGARDISCLASRGGWSSRGHQPTSRQAPNLKPALGEGQDAVAGAVASACAQLSDAQAGSGKVADGLGHDCPHCQIRRRRAAPESGPPGSSPPLPVALDPNLPAMLLQSGRTASHRFSSLASTKRPFVISRTRPVGATPECRSPAHLAKTGRRSLGRQ